MPNQQYVTPTILVGTAGWALPAPFVDRFPRDGSHLARYSQVFGAVEINSSFYRPHLRTTYARWAASVPEGFRFSVKMPKTITHEGRLVETNLALDAFIGQVSALGHKLGCILVQLPPSLDYGSATADAFFAALRDRYPGDVAVEPRHATWFAPESASLLAKHRCARVAADPARVPAAAEPGDGAGFEYWRLHGSPRMYASSYDDAYLQGLAERMARARASGKHVWCIFDNTMFGASVANGLAIQSHFARAAATNAAR